MSIIQAQKNQIFIFPDAIFCSPTYLLMASQLEFEDTEPVVENQYAS